LGISRKNQKFLLKKAKTKKKRTKKTKSDFKIIKKGKKKIKTKKIMTLFSIHQPNYHVMTEKQKIFSNEKKRKSKSKSKRKRE